MLKKGVAICLFIGAVVTFVAYRSGAFTAKPDNKKTITREAGSNQHDEAVKHEMEMMWTSKSALVLDETWTVSDFNEEVKSSEEEVKAERERVAAIEDEEINNKSSVAANVNNLNIGASSKSITMPLSVIYWPWSELPKPASAVPGTSAIDTSRLQK